VGWFGVIADTAKAEDIFTVNECHINWWALPTLIPGRRLFILDVGLNVTAPTSKELLALTVVMPVDVERVRWEGHESTWAQDLSDALHHRDVCSQVFGERVTIRDTSNSYDIEFPSGKHLEIVRALVADATPVDIQQNPRSDLSIWRIPLESPIPVGASRYTRFRVSIFRTGAVWRWNRVWLGRAGAQVDLRIADVREALREDRERQYWTRVIPIEQLNIFFIVPSTLQAQVFSPELHYVRRLEAGQWGDYLRGTRYRASLTGLRVYYWRYPAGATAGQIDPVTIDNPFRVFLDLTREVAIPGWVAVLRTILAVVIALGIVHIGVHVKSVDLHWVGRVPALLKWIFGTSLLAIAAAVTAYVRLAKSRFRGVRLSMRRVERALLKPFTSR
jgi:hypothetical protein